MPNNGSVPRGCGFFEIVGYSYHIADLHGVRVGNLWNESRCVEVRYECKQFSRYSSGTFVIWFRLSIAKRSKEFSSPAVDLHLTVHEHGKLMLEVDAQIINRVPSNLQLKTYIKKGEWEEAVQAHAYICGACRHSNFFVPPGPTKHQQRVERLASVCINFVGRNKRTPYKQEGSAVHTGWVEYRNNGLVVRCCVQESSIGSGYCGVTVLENNKLVFNTQGCHRSEPHRMMETVYIPGEWEITICGKDE